MRALVTGAAGFIGSNLTERLLAEGHSVTAVDNLSGGCRDFLQDCFPSPAFRFEEIDLLDLPALEEVMEDQEVVFHLAANSNIPEGMRQTDIDLRLGTLATYHVLEAMRRRRVQQIIFSSSSVVYGEPRIIPTPEDYGPLFPISLYGASKLACEGLISAFCHNYGFHAWIFRFANICGRHATHGVMIDFMRKLRANDRRLEILGDGKQAKPYLHVGECVGGMLYGWRHVRNQLNYFNLGCEGATNTKRLARLLLETMELRHVELVFTGGERGWPGDVPQVRLDCTKLNGLGWRAQLASDEAVKLATVQVVEEFACKLSS